LSIFPLQSDEASCGVRFSSVCPHVVFASSVAFFLIAASVGWNHAIVEGSPHRETQTAMTVYYMLRQPFKLAYETPLWGPPWSIPMEFPVYQWVVAGMVGLFHLPLEATGKAVSLGFFLLTLIPVNYLLAALGLRERHRLLVLSLILLSPFYIFYSRTFMIESTALFLSTSYCALVVSHARAPRPATFLAALTMGTLAALVKITSFVPWFLAAWLWSSLHWAGKSAKEKPAWLSLARLSGSLLLATVPWVAVGWWTYFADHVKAQNPLTERLTSQALASWNFGTLPQRLSLASWSAILGSWNNIVPHWSVLLVSALGVCLACKHRLAYFGCAALAISAPLIFFNLHAVHEYYPYANGLLLVGAVGIAIAALLERGQRYRWAGGALFVLFACVSVFRYGSGFYPRLASDPGGKELSAIARSVKQLTQPGDVLLVVGSDWSPVIPFYCERRALMVPADRQWAAEAIQAYRQWFGEHAGGRTAATRSASPSRRVGALVVVEPPNSPVDLRSLQALLAAFDLDRRGRRVAGHCLLFTRNPDHTLVSRRPEPARR
jgi:hypothetical protein